MRLKGKRAETEARSKAGADRVPNTTPSHPLADYVGEYEHPAYGVLKIGEKDGQLQFDFHKMRFAMTHYHYDRFDTPDDERFGKWSVNFSTDPQGDVSRAVMSMDEAEAAFQRRPDRPDLDTLRKLAGAYETPTGFRFQVVLKDNGDLLLSFPGEPDQRLVPYKGLKFRVPEFSDVVFEFVVENGQARALKQKDAAGEHTFTRK